MKKFVKNKFAAVIATYFGFGMSPKAPGTVGSLATLPLAFAACYWFGIYGILSVAAISFVIGVPAISALIDGQEDKDPKRVVIDEVCGQSLSFIFLAEALRGNADSWVIYLLGFIFFRFFDICKMGPVKFFDSKVKNAYGVMLDDVCAGIMAAGCLWLCNSFLLPYFNF